MRRLSIIGPGRVGKSLGKLMHQHQALELSAIVARSSQAALLARDFIGTGNALSDLSQASPVEVWMLSIPDDQIDSQAKLLTQRDVLREGDIVFHCSGSKSSQLLASVKQQGALIASVHPVRSFANPVQVVEDFEGTYCGIEGDAAACEVLKNIFDRIGAQTFALSSEHKLRYHAASVFASNYLVSLIDVAQRCYESAGVDSVLARALAQPLASKTLENCFRLGTSAALTGPIKRGDFETVEAQAQDLLAWNEEIAAAYRAFIPLTKDVAEREINKPHSEK